MASTRTRRPFPPPSARNPFDSSDDEKDAVKATSSRREYVNPFDDDGDCGSVAVAKANSRPHRSNPVPQARVKNPFDDYDDDDEAAEKYIGQKQGSLKDKLDKGSLFDEEPRFHGEFDMNDQKSKSKLPTTSALKKVQKLKDAGASQASKFVEGGIHQAQRLKESSFNAFKPSEGKANPSRQEQNHPGLSSTFGKDVHDRKPDTLHASGSARSQLLAEDARPPSTFNKGGLYETGSFSVPHRNCYEDNQFQGADLEQKSVQELEGYALQKSEDTTKHIQNCLKVAEDIKGDATRTLVTLHQQGEQLRRTHDVAYDIDQNLTAGEKLLGSLGGMFSRTWKPKRSPAIKGPVDDPKDFEIRRKGHHLEQRTALGLEAKGQTDRSSYDASDSQMQTTEAKLGVERLKQDDALSDLSNVLDQLKEMSIDMGNEIGRQNVALDHFQNDVVILDERMKGANAQGRHLLKK